MFLEIITPDEKVYEGEVDSATFPGSDGSFQVLSDHAPLISTLGEGDIKFVKPGANKKPEETRILVSGGVVEVMNNKVTVLAEKVVGD